MSSFVEGGEPPTGAPHELIQFPPETPLPPWPQERKKALLLVAHPDDEALFAGGLLLHYPEWEWHLVCMTGTEERRAQFNAAVEMYRREGTNIASVRNHEFEDRLRMADRRLWLAALAKEDCTSWDIVFTHGARGEYGHHHHIWLNAIASLIYENVWDFLSPCWRVKQLRKTLVHEVPTDARKAAIFRAAYGSIAEGLEKHAPWLTEYQLGGHREFFTQAIVGL